MPALKPTAFTAEVVWLGHVADRDAALASSPAAVMNLSFAGPEGEAHGGLTRPSDSRVLSQYPRNTNIRNTRQLSILSEEDLAAIAAEMGLEAFDPAWVGAWEIMPESCWKCTGMVRLCCSAVPRTWARES